MRQSASKEVICLQLHQWAILGEKALVTTSPISLSFHFAPKALSFFHVLEPLEAITSRKTIRRPSFSPPASLPPGFSLIHLIVTGVSCFLGSGLLTLAVYLSCQHCQRQSQESTLVHPATPNHLHYKSGGTPKNEKYTPMEFKVGISV